MATIVVRASGYRVAKSGHDFYTFQALAAANPLFANAALVFDAARSKRNNFSYDTPTPISDTDADDLLNTAERFQKEAEKWVRADPPEPGVAAPFCARKLWPPHPLDYSAESPFPERGRQAAARGWSWRTP